MLELMFSSESSGCELGDGFMGVVRKKFDLGFLKCVLFEQAEKGGETDSWALVGEQLPAFLDRKEIHQRSPDRVENDTVGFPARQLDQFRRLISGSILAQGEHRLQSDTCFGIVQRVDQSGFVVL